MEGEPLAFDHLLRPGGHMQRNRALRQSNPIPAPPGQAPRFGMFTTEMAAYVPRGRQRDVYLALAAHTSEMSDRVCWPSQATLAELAGCSVRTVERAVGELRAAGAIEVGARTFRGRKVGNRYRVAFTGEQVERNRRRQLIRPVDNPAERVDNARFARATEPPTVTGTNRDTEPPTVTGRSEQTSTTEQTTRYSSRGDARDDRATVENTISGLARRLRLAP